jgi:hypothetical protein
VRIRQYNPESDFDAVTRIWQEVGWIERGNDDHQEGLRHFVSEYTGLVAELDGAAECYVATGPGTIRYLDNELALSVVAAVTTSVVARRQGLAQRLTAEAIAHDAAKGALVSGLGIFDQGFYNKLGYGTGVYEHWYALDPAHLRIPGKPRPPRRVTKDDWEAMHRARRRRLRGHGSCTIEAAAATRSETLWASNGFGLGYNDGASGELSHYVWFSAKDLENGPLNAWWMAYESLDQFMELMAAIASLGDQIHIVRMREPAPIQLQDLIDQPFRRNRISEKSTYESRNRSAAYMQFRMCDIPACLAATKLDGYPVRFNLRLRDPIGDLLDDSVEWRGVAGDYVVELGRDSSATTGVDGNLRTLEASVGAFTRLWMGVRPATGLAATDELAAPADLLGDLDRALRLPPPKADWDF